MGPKKGKKKGKNDHDQQFRNEEQIVSKWAQALEQSEEKDQQPNVQELYSKANKSIFQYDFSHQRALDLKQEPVKPQKDRYADFTPEELQQLKRIKEQAKLDMEVKTKIKNEKKNQRRKQKQAQKAVQQAEKQKQAEQMKKVQQQMEKQKKKQSNPWIIPLGLLLFLIGMFFLQYQKELFERLSKFKSEDIDYYEVLEADQSITDKQLKNKYKKLVMKYHPDRNPDCQNCKQKFDRIMKAWEILGDPEKRKSYDQNSGYISELKSASTTLTPHNYHYEVEEGNSVWLIQVFDSTNQYSRYFAQFWEQIYNNYGDIIKFGRIDIWHQSDMNSYIPYKFQVFPSVYSLDQGYSEICSFNYERPIDGLKKCIEDVYLKTQYNFVKQLPETVTPMSSKIHVYLNDKLRANLRIKAYNKKYEKYFQFFFIQKQSSPRKATVFFKGEKYIFNFTENSKKMFTSYSQSLQSFIIQQISTCAFLQQCEEKKCILILNRTKILQIQNQLPLKHKKDVDNPSIYILSDNQKHFEKQIRLIQEQDHHENFDIGLYEGGRIDLGYLDEADILNPEEGERLDLECKFLTWKDKIIELYKSMLGSQSQD